MDLFSVGQLVVFVCLDNKQINDLELVVKILEPRKVRWVKAKDKMENQLAYLVEAPELRYPTKIFACMQQYLKPINYDGNIKISWAECSWKPKTHFGKQQV